ncbi:translation initiation factor IF-2, partial [Thermoproteota archaeon]
EVMRAILSKGLLLNLNSEIDAQTAVEIAEVLNIKLEPEKKAASSTIRDSMDKIEEEELDRDPDALVERPAVITIMGHVDHGKTLLLDAIRKSSLVLKEAGGITQHIGAYQVKVKEKKITFLDTPGHAAFTALRARGAQVTDIAVLVVAADDGVKQQTLEAIHHAKAANVPIIVAINKIDKPGVDIERTRQQLSDNGLVPEDWGGKTIMVPISAKSKQGLDDLLDMIMLVAEMMELRAIPKGRAKGVIIESRLSRRKGPVATVLVKTGTLHIGDHFVIGSSMGKVRAMLNDLGDRIKEAPPGMPVEVMGITEVPQPGSILKVLPSEKACREWIQKQQSVVSQSIQLQKRTVSLEAMSHQIEEGETGRLNIILKADVHGSLEAIVGSVSQIESKDITVNILHAATGAITENDIMLARASDGLVIGFNVMVNPEAKVIADSEAIEIRTYTVIYEIIDDIRKVVEGLFKPEFEEVETAKIEVRQLFKFSKVGVIAGCHVLSGKVIRNMQARIFREGKEIFKGKITSLKRFKEDIKEVAAGFECGIVMQGFDKFREGDQINCFEIREKKR